MFQINPHPPPVIVCALEVGADYIFGTVFAIVTYSSDDGVDTEHIYACIYTYSRSITRCNHRPQEITRSPAWDPLRAQPTCSRAK